MSALTETVAGTNSSVVVGRCQICANSGLEPILFLGYLPPVNRMNPIGKNLASKAAIRPSCFTVRGVTWCSLG